MRYLLILLPLVLYQSSTGAEKLTTIGWVEQVRIMPENIILKAKIDTGADNSSLGVTEWNSFFRDDEEWVRFKVIGDDGRKLLFERTLDKYARIKRKQVESIRRPVVKMLLCIDGRKSLVPVNLSLRKKFEYQMLVGRSLLKGVFLVDAAAKLTSSPLCGPP